MNRWTSKLSFVGRGAWAVGIAAAAGALIAFLLVPTFPSSEGEAVKDVQVRLLGQPLALNDQAMRVALERVRRYATTDLHLRIGEGKIRDVSLGRLGAQIDKLRLTSLVREARDPHSLLRRHHALNNPSKPIELPVPIVLHPTDAERELLRLKDETDRLPADARMNLETRALVAETEGRRLDIDKTYVALEHALSRGEQSVDAVFDRIVPKRLAKELADVKFGSILGAFETRYDRSDRSRDRTYNLRLAASKLDGTVLLPGEVFDFNEVVGPRDEANGYRVATVIAEGELVDGLGGGTCQISGTLHGAAFFSGLDIVERVPHTRPSSYIKMGLDATVVYPTINFRFRNSYPFAVVLHETVKNGVVRAEVLGPERKHTVTLIRRITDHTAYEQLEREDARLPRGMKVLSQRGVAGFTVVRYRIVREGSFARRQRWLDKYPATPQIIRVGTGDMSPDSVKIADDPHPEYLADELLVMTQGSEPAVPAEQPSVESDDNEQSPSGDKNSTSGEMRDGSVEAAPKPTKDSRISGESGLITEWRQAGKTGVPGWTREQKMPQWESKTDESPKDSKRARPLDKKETTSDRNRAKRAPRTTSG